MKEVKNMYIVENECLEPIRKNIIEYINELEVITKDNIIELTKGYNITIIFIFNDETK